MLARWIKRSAALAVLVAALASGPAPAADADYLRYFNAAVRLYESLEYERALEQLERARKLSRGPDDDVALALYEGTIRFDLGQTEQGRAAFKTALLLRPDVALPFKVSPKVRREFEDLRRAVKKELEPLLRKQREEEERKRKEDEARKAEEARKADEARKAEDARKAEEARKLAEAQRAEEERRARQLAAELEERQRRVDQLRNEEERLKAQAELDALRRAADAPRQVTLEPPPAPPVVQAPPPPAKRKFPVAGVVFLGVGAAAGGVATYFGVESNRLVGAARAANYQDETVAQLRQAQTNATVANVAIGTAAAAAVASLISFIVWGVEPVGPVSGAGAP